MKRIVLLLVLSLVTVVSSVEAATITVFGQSTGANLFTGNETGGITVLDANGIPVIITTLNETGVSLPAFFSLDATSTGPAVNVPTTSLYTQPYSGTFSITNGGFNYLSGTFDGVQLGLLGGQTFIFGSAEPPLSLNFTSDVVGMSLDNPTAMALSLTNVIPGVTIVNNSFGDFTSNVSGTFSAGPPVPEPASLILLGTGLLGLVRARRSFKSK